MAVVANGVHAEGGHATDGVGVVVVEALPGVAVSVEDEVAGEEEDAGAHLAALAHPVSLHPDRGIGLGGQAGGQLEGPARHNLANDARVVVVMLQRDRWTTKKVFSFMWC